MSWRSYGRYLSSSLVKYRALSLLLSVILTGGHLNCNYILASLIYTCSARINLLSQTSSGICPLPPNVFFSSAPLFNSVCSTCVWNWKNVQLVGFAWNPIQITFLYFKWSSAMCFLRALAFDSGHIYIYISLKFGGKFLCSCSCDVGENWFVRLVVSKCPVILGDFWGLYIILVVYGNFRISLLVRL